MQSILEELYMGSIGFDTGRYPNNSPFARAARRRMKSREQLEALLDDKGRELFDSYCDAEGDVDDIARYDTFTSALRFGILLMLAVLYDADGATPGVRVPLWEE